MVMSLWPQFFGPSCKRFCTHVFSSFRLYDSPGDTHSAIYGIASDAELADMPGDWSNVEWRSEGATTTDVNRSDDDDEDAGESPGLWWPTSSTTTTELRRPNLTSDAPLSLDPCAGRITYAWELRAPNVRFKLQVDRSENAFALLRTGNRKTYE